MTDNDALRGTPACSLPEAAVAAWLERLVAYGVIGSDCIDDRPTASRRPRVRAVRPVSRLISEQRR